MKMKAWSIGGTIQEGDDRSTRRKTCCSSTVCITHPPGTGSSFNPDRLRQCTSVKAKNHVPFISKFQLPPHRKHSPLYKEPGMTTWRFSGCWLWEPDATETHRAACSQIQRLHVRAVGMPSYHCLNGTRGLSYFARDQLSSSDCRSRKHYVCRDWGTPWYNGHCHTTHQTRAWHRL